MTAMPMDDYWRLVSSLTFWNLDPSPPPKYFWNDGIFRSPRVGGPDRYNAEKMGFARKMLGERMARDAIFLSNYFYWGLFNQDLWDMKICGI